MRQIFLFFFCFSFSLFAADKPKVCLNMIVKNEEAVIEKSLESVKKLIDYWVIVDTGSTDQTKEKIQKVLKGIPGELYDRPWVDFQHNRNEALDLARDKAEYLLFLDADECFVYDDHFSFPSLKKQDGYYVKVRQIGAVDFLRATLVKSSLPWKWSGALHECLVCDQPFELAVLDGVINLCNTHQILSGRSVDPDKYLNDAKRFEKLLEEDPNNARYVYYLAQSYAAANQFERAVKHYQRRSYMPSQDDQETFFANYYAGKYLERLEKWEEALDWHLKAYFFRRTRAEPLFRAAIVYRQMGNPFIGYLLTKYASQIPVPKDSCIEYLVYDHEITIEEANCALLSGLWQEGLDACNRLLLNQNLPEEVRSSVLSNKKVAEEMLEKSKLPYIIPKQSVH